MLELKWIALICLVLQNSGLAIMMRYTLITDNKSKEPYMTSTAVFLAELLKFVISTSLVFIYDVKMNSKQFSLTLKQELGNRNDWIKLMIPSILYTIQNSLQYYSMSCLSAAVFQVLYQMKIITTAVFSVLLLSRRLGGLQWLSIVALSGGVALVQLSQMSDSNNSNKSNSILGLISVLCGCMTSGFAGVYFEVVLKSSVASVWLRNMQLSLIGMATCLISCYLRDKDEILQKGFLSGYDEYVWSVILLQAAGGLIVAVVVKYADNVLKGFATSLSILISAFVSSYLFGDVDINQAFLCGCIVVLASVFAFGYVPAQKVTKVLST